MARATEPWPDCSTRPASLASMEKRRRLGHFARPEIGRMRNAGPAPPRVLLSFDRREGASTPCPTRWRPPARFARTSRDRRSARRSSPAPPGCRCRLPSTFPVLPRTTPQSPRRCTEDGFSTYLQREGLSHDCQRYDQGASSVHRRLGARLIERQNPDVTRDAGLLPLQRDSAIFVRFEVGRRGREAPKWRSSHRQREAARRRANEDGASAPSIRSGRRSPRRTGTRSSSTGPAASRNCAAISTSLRASIRWWRRKASKGSASCSRQTKRRRWVRRRTPSI